MAEWTLPFIAAVELDSIGETSPLDQKKKIHTLQILILSLLSTNLSNVTLFIGLS